MSKPTGTRNLQSEVATNDALINCLEKFVHHLPEKINTSNAASYLSRLRNSLVTLEKEEPDHETSVALKKQIENVCVISEVLFTQKISESTNKGSFFYSCSSLVDNGITEYLSSPGWLILLRAMKQSARKNDGKFTRVFFIKSEKIDSSDLVSLEKIITLHLKNGIGVSLVEDDQISGEAREKRNMAWLNGKVLIDATNQIDWDLDITKQTHKISEAREKYDFIIKRSTINFHPNEIHKVKEILSIIFSQQCIAPMH